MTISGLTIDETGDVGPWVASELVAGIDRPELLAPAGDWDCLRAAVENGADAVYFGLDSGFNARARAHNFPIESLPETMGFLHERGVKGFVTLNTLIFSSELEEFEQTVRSCASAGVDAVLVQDLGVVRLIKAICPELAIHASTQMTMTSAETIREIEELGVERVVLARELSIKEIEAIRRSTTLPLETFVHGALCVAYSGQCMTSESLGGRSANRGQCAQACRLPYDLVCDGEDVDLGDKKYLLSPQDLAAYALVEDLVKVGVASLKIEGRLKQPEYVANITRHYRLALDRATAGKRHGLESRDVEEMELSFSRGFSPGWLNGCDHKMLVPADNSAKRGVQVGKILTVKQNSAYVRVTRGVQAGDGIVFESPRFGDTPQGGRIYQVRSEGRRLDGACLAGDVELFFAEGSIDFDRLFPGQPVWKTDDPHLTKRLRRSFTAADPLRKRPIRIAVEAAVGKPLVVRVSLETQPVGELTTDFPLEAARNRPLTEDVLIEQFARLGGTPFALVDLTANIAGGPMVPLSVLGKLRRDLVDLLTEFVHRPLQRTVASEPQLPRLRVELATLLAPSGGTGSASASAGENSSIADELSGSDLNSGTLAEPVPPEGSGNGQASLRILARTLKQVDVLLEQGERDLYADFQDIREYREAIDRAKAAGASLFPATPRIQKPGEMGLFRAMRKHEPDGVLVRNLSGLAFFVEQGIEAVADYTLNVTNELTFADILRRGASRATASYDLNREQLLDLVEHATPAQRRLEIVLHQHMPLFHMEHCVFCSVLSPGTNKTNCGRPCDTHEVKLRDRMGKEHPLKADVGCRNTLFNATPQSGAEAAPALLARGVTNFRIELLEDAPAEEVAETIRLYRELLAGSLTGKAVWSALKATNRIGVTRGTLEERRDPLAIV
ncbi:MAG TPA: DUF3656 domain-containing protein [Pirellulaceae bacterium]|jgi:putative protease|nr:DUF3656 domain-containing protein [Pirellulaceae bacterium]